MDVMGKGIYHTWILFDLAQTKSTRHPHVQRGFMCFYTFKGCRMRWIKVRQNGHGNHSNLQAVFIRMRSGPFIIFWRCFRRVKTPFGSPKNPSNSRLWAYKIIGCIISSCNPSNKESNKMKPCRFRTCWGLRSSFSENLKGLGSTHHHLTPEFLEVFSLDTICL